MAPLDFLLKEFDKQHEINMPNANLLRMLTKATIFLGLTSRLKLDIMLSKVDISYEKCSPSGSCPMNRVPVLGNMGYSNGSQNSDQMATSQIFFS